VKQKQYNYSENNHCKCGKLIGNLAKKCYLCEMKRRIKLGMGKGINNPNFKDGSCCFKHFCIDCGKSIDKQGRSKRCPKCYHKNRKNKSINHSKKCKCAICKAKRGEYKGNRFGFIDGRTLKKYYCIDCNKKISNYQHKRCPSCSNIYRWKNDNFKDKTLKAMLLSRLIKPNKPEKVLRNLLNIFFPKQYKFVGDGKRIVGGFCPDFINIKQKKIIEMFGDYWHKLLNVKKTDKRKLRIYKKLGYSTLIVWEHELKNIDILTKKIKEFNNV